MTLTGITAQQQQLQVVHADTEKQCTKYDGTHYKKLFDQQHGGCEWYVDQLMGQGWALYTIMPMSTDSGGICDCDVYYMLK